MSGWRRWLPWAGVPNNRSPVATSEAENSEDDDAKTALAVEGVKQAYVAAHKSDKRNELIRHAVDAITVIGLILTVVYTVRTYHVFEKQLGVMQKAIVAAHNDARAQTNEADNAANSAWQISNEAVTTGSIEASNALRVATDTENRQLRAYVWAVPREVENFAPGQIPRWGVTYGAIGETPAYSAELHEIVVFMSYPNRPDMRNIFHAAKRKGEFTSVIIPGKTAAGTTIGLECLDHGNSNAPLIPCAVAPDFTVIADGKRARLYALGYVAYVDAFGARHHLPFCFSYDPMASGPKGEVCPNTPAPD
jgi:hypothetical protein